MKKYIAPMVSPNIDNLDNHLPDSSKVIRDDPDNSNLFEISSVMCQPPTVCLNQSRWFSKVIRGFRILLQHSNTSAQHLLNLR